MEKKVCIACKKAIQGVVIEINGDTIHWCCGEAYKRLPKETLSLDQLIEKIRKQ